MPQGDTVFFPMTDYWMGRLVDGRRVEVRARTAHWARLIPGRRYARFQVGNFRGPQLLFMVAAVEVVSRSTLLELAEPALRDFLVSVTAPEVYLVRLSVVTYPNVTKKQVPQATGGARWYWFFNSR